MKYSWTSSCWWSYFIQLPWTAAGSSWQVWKSEQETDSCTDSATAGQVTFPDSTSRCDFYSCWYFKRLSSTSFSLIFTSCSTRVEFLLTDRFDDECNERFLSFFFFLNNTLRSTYMISSKLSKSNNFFMKIVTFYAFDFIFMYM